MKSAMTHAAPRWNLQQAPTLWNCSGCTAQFSARLAISKAHTDPWYTRGFQNSVRVWLYHKIIQAASRSHM